MKFEQLDIPDVVALTPDIFSDHRGQFFESFRASDLIKAVPDKAVLADDGFVQGSVSTSLAWTLRGLHYQITEPQGKLVHCVRGSIFDVAVDLRRSSPTFGRWVGRVLDDQFHIGMWIPPGFAHGFLSLASGATVVYQCSTYHRKDADRAIRWDDPTIGVRWPTNEKQAVPLISQKDRSAPFLADAECFA